MTLANVDRFPFFHCQLSKEILFIHIQRLSTIP